MRNLVSAAFLLALGLLLAAEAGVRLFLPHGVSGRFSYGYDLQAGFVEQGNGQVKLVRAGGRRFYPQTFSYQRPPDCWRILVIGDSVPRGPNLTASYAGRLQEELSLRNIRSEVINMAIPGYGARRCQLVLRQGLKYEPNLIILHLNDSNEFEDEREYRRSLEFRGWHVKHWPMKVFIFARAYEIKTEKILWRLIPEKIRLQSAVNDADAEVRASQDQQQQRLWGDRVREVTKATVEMARNRDVPLILVTQGTIAQNNGATWNIDDGGLDELARSLVGPGVYLLSMKQVFSRLTGIQSYFSDGAHLTRKGHEVMAQALADLISSRLAEQVALQGRAGR
ncbi:MAG TPA: hypothetical protein DCY27_12840 [Desulfobacterales bacterium]|nr:hypothetical protein [Desulfobacterales bacterium]